MTSTTAAWLQLTGYQQVNFQNKSEEKHWKDSSWVLADLFAAELNFTVSSISRPIFQQ